MRHCCNVFQRTILQRTSTEVNVYIQCHQTRSFACSDIGKVIYHKFSHSDISYSFNGKNVNTMLVYLIV